MTPSADLVTDLLTLLADDTATLSKSGGSENKVKLVLTDFTPSRDLDIGTLTLATFTGSTPKNAASGNQQVGNDPVVGMQFIEIVPPAGGWYWECTATPSPAQQVFGAILTDNAGTTLWGAVKLANPVLISAIGDSVQIGTIRFYESDLLSR